MYLDPFTETVDGLFALDDARTERDLPFAFDRDVDYFARVDALMPPWRPPSYHAREGSGAALTETAGLQELRQGRTSKVISRRRYVRAIDPAGRLRQLKVSTVPCTPEYPNGDDRIGTLQRVIAEKSRRGWLIVEREPMTWSPYSGRQGQQYCAWALAVAEHRRKRAEDHERSEAQMFVSTQQRDARRMHQETLDAQREGMREFAQTIASAVARPGDQRAETRPEPRKRGE